MTLPKPETCVACGEKLGLGPPSCDVCHVVRWIYEIDEAEEWLVPKERR